MESESIQRVYRQREGRERKRRERGGYTHVIISRSYIHYMSYYMYMRKRNETSSWLR
jgi:hypothetical protein